MNRIGKLMLILTVGLAVGFATPQPKTEKAITPVIANGPMPICPVIKPNCPF